MRTHTWNHNHSTFVFWDMGRTCGTHTAHQHHLRYTSFQAANTQYVVPRTTRSGPKLMTLAYSTNKPRVLKRTQRAFYCTTM